MKRPILVVVLVLMAAVMAGCKEEVNLTDPSVLPKKKQTELGLYLTAAEAYDNWKADPENIVILDIRTPEEYIFVGHPEMAWNVPFKIATYETTADGQPELVMKTTPDFVERAKKVVKPTDTIYVICRSGRRSAVVVNLLADEGFKNVYNVVDGFEGNKASPKSMQPGKRVINGWRNADRPWTYEMELEKMLLPAEVLKPGTPKTE